MMMGSASKNTRRRINEKVAIISSEKTLWQLKDEIQPTADLVIYRGKTRRGIDGPESGHRRPPPSQPGLEDPFG